MKHAKEGAPEQCADAKPDEEWQWVDGSEIPASRVAKLYPGRKLAQPGAAAPPKYDPSSLKTPEVRYCATCMGVARAARSVF